jgi:hypothetical protein
MKKFLLLISGLLISTFSFCQLDKVAKLTSFVNDPVKAAGINILLNTKDFTKTFNPTSEDQFRTSVQLVKLTKPFPPMWYQLGLGVLSPNSDFYLGPTINESTGHLSYGFSIVPDSVIHPVFEGYVILDTTTMEPVDTLTGADFTFDSIYQAVDNHEYEEDTHDNKLFFSVVKTRIDVRCLSGNPADSLMWAIVQYIVVLDSANQIKFVWNPLKYLSPCEMYWEYRNSSTTYPGALNWSHGNSLRWANDGNILYSYRHIGVGKINSTTGEIMFKLGGKDSINSISLPDSIGYALQHDFYQRADGYYSLFSNGSSIRLPFMEGLVYDIDENAKTVQLIDRIKPSPDCISAALGGLDTYNNMYVLNRGMNFCASSIFEMVDVVNISDQSPVAQIYGPSLNFSYRAHPTVWNISRRPLVSLENGELKTDSLPGLYGYTWYKVGDTTADNVGTGLTYNPTTSGKYVVEARAGTGSFTSFLVSDVFDFVLTNIKNSANKSIALRYDPLGNMATIDLKDGNGQLRIFNLKGQEVISTALKSSSNAVYFKNTPGIYIFDITTANEHLAAKVFVN